MLLSFWIIVLIVSLFVLVKFCNIFILSAENIGLAIGISQFIIGVIFVGFGTSLPELVSSIIAIQHNSPEIVVGNVLGSNIINVLLLVSIVVFVSGRICFEHDLMRLDVPYLLGSSLIIALMMIDGQFSRGEAIISLGCLTGYIISCIKSKKEIAAIKKSKIKIKDIILIIISPILIVVSGKYTVDSVIKISQLAHIGMEAISFSVIAFGTSLPEIIVSIQAAKKKKVELILGNIFGGNIFKSFSVMGIPALIHPLTISKSIIDFCMPVSVAATVLFLFVLLDKKIHRSEGVLLFLFYVFFVLKLFQTV
jgi:cation:H+ antiporter